MNIYQLTHAKKILLIGDIMLDTYFNGDVRRISPEAPVPVFRKKDERSVLGGAANVAANLVAANQEVHMLSVIGNDADGETIRALFAEMGVHTDMLLGTDRPTTVKTRFIARHNQQVLRLDVEDTSEISPEIAQQLTEMLEKNIDQFDLIVLSDYLKGLLTFDFTQKVLQMAREHHIPALVDVKDPKVEKYTGAYLLKPNVHELRALTGMPAEDDDGIIEASRYLCGKCQCEYVLTTCGARGMILVGHDEVHSVETMAKDVYDVTGAGDTTIAYLAAGVANKLALEHAMEIANMAAGIQVGKMGTSAVSLQEVIDAQRQDLSHGIHKLLTEQEIKLFRSAHADKKIVFTNGCFDILHIGHLRYLQEAASLGDILVLGLNSDASVKRLKGEERPINNEQDRAEMISALSFVDYVAVFEEDTPLELIKAIQPDVLVKGGDYQNEYVVGTNEVEARGGKLVLIPFVEGKSTTNIIEKIKK